MDLAAASGSSGSRVRFKQIGSRLMGGSSALIDSNLRELVPCVQRDGAVDDPRRCTTTGSHSESRAIHDVDPASQRQQEQRTTVRRNDYEQDRVRVLGDVITDVG